MTKKWMRSAAEPRPRLSLRLMPEQQRVFAEEARRSGMAWGEQARRIFDDWVDGKLGAVYPLPYVRNRDGGGRRPKVDFCLTARQADALHRAALAQDIPTTEQARWVIAAWLEMQKERAVPRPLLLGETKR